MPKDKQIKCPACGVETHAAIREPHVPLRCACGTLIVLPSAATEITCDPDVPRAKPVLTEHIDAVEEDPANIVAPPLDSGQADCLFFGAMSVLTTCGPPAGFLFGYRAYAEAERLLTAMRCGEINSYFERMVKICWWLGVVSMVVNSLLVSWFVIWLLLRISLR